MVLQGPWWLQRNAMPSRCLKQQYLGCVSKWSLSGAFVFRNDPYPLCFKMSLIRCFKMIRVPVHIVSHCAFRQPQNWTEFSFSRKQAVGNSYPLHNARLELRGQACSEDPQQQTSHLVIICQAWRVSGDGCNRSTASQVMIPMYIHYWIVVYPTSIVCFLFINDLVRGT